MNIIPQAIDTEIGTRGIPSGITLDPTNITPVANNKRTLLSSDGIAIDPKINGFTSIVFHVTLDTFAVLLNIVTLLSI
jgi:hypothetical protein